MDTEDFEFKKVAISILPNSELAQRIDSFLRRSEDLRSFVCKNVSGSMSISIRKKKISGNLPDSIVLEGWYRRFRFFILNKEKANYYRLLRLLSMTANDELVSIFCRYMKKELYAGSQLNWSYPSDPNKYKPQDIIDIWFNAYYFHDQEVEQEKLADLKAIVSENGAEITLFHAVRGASRVILNLEYVLHQTKLGNTHILVPYMSKIC